MIGHLHIQHTHYILALCVLTMGILFAVPGVSNAACTTYEGSRSCAEVAGAYGIPADATDGSVTFSQTVCDGVWQEPVMTGGGCSVPPPPPPVCNTYEGTISCAEVAGSWGIPVYHTEGSISYSQTECDGVWEAPIQTGGSCSAPPDPPTPCSKTNACNTHTTNGYAVNGVCDAPEPNVDNSCIQVCTTHGPTTESCAAAIDRLEARDGAQSTYFGYPAHYTEGTVTYTQDSCVQNGVTTWQWPVIQSGSCSAPPTNGVCGGSVNSCNAGSFSDVADTASYYRWSCVGSDGGSTASCLISSVVYGCTDPLANNFNSSANTDDGSCTYPTPPVPTGLSASAGSCGSGTITLSWNSASGATVYGIKDNSSLIETVSGTSYTHSGLTAGSAHTYSVNAANAWGASAYSSSVSVTAPANCPVQGTCGAAHGYGATTQPSSDLCSAGTASAITGTGPWSWTCLGAWGGNNISCSAPVLSGSFGPETQTVIYNGTAELTWGSIQNASACRIDSTTGEIWESVSLAGGTVTTGQLTNDATYILSCNGQPIAEARITVETEPVLSVSSRVLSSGSLVTISYNTQGRSCTLSGGLINETVSAEILTNRTPYMVRANTTFTLACPDGTATAVVEIVPRTFES